MKQRESNPTSEMCENKLRARKERKSFDAHCVSPHMIHSICVSPRYDASHLVLYILPKETISFFSRQP